MTTKAERAKNDSESELRSLDEFNKRFYPKPIEVGEDVECPDADAVAEKLVKQSLEELQIALSAK